jgi:hypothetical protein
VISDPSAFSLAFSARTSALVCVSVSLVDLIEEMGPTRTGWVPSERDLLAPELLVDCAVPVSTAALVHREGVAAIAELDPKRLRGTLTHVTCLGRVREGRPQICSGFQGCSK